MSELLIGRTPRECLPPTSSIRWNDPGRNCAGQSTRSSNVRNRTEGSRVGVKFAGNVSSIHPQDSVISIKDTLPAAVDYEDRAALVPLSSDTLHGFLTNCQRWRSWMDGLQAGLCTAAGRTEWDVLMRCEHEQVAAAHDRVRDEIDARGTDPAPS